jgi:RNA polymerase sigma-54 factor
LREVRRRLSLKRSTRAMAFGPRLELRQSQSLVMTPQLLQAIKLLQLSTVDLVSYVEAELERNPLLDRVDEPGDAPVANELGGAGEQDRFQSDDFDGGGDGAGDDPGSGGAAADGRSEGDWASDTLQVDAQAIARDLDTDVGNAFPDEAMPATASAMAQDGPSLPGFDSVVGGLRGAPLDDDETGPEGYLATEETLQDRLSRQLMPKLKTAADRWIGAILIEAIEPTGYLGETTASIAERLAADEADVVAVLALLQTCEPAGVGARDLAECLALQLKERDRLDPAMEALVANLDLVAKRDFTSLRRACRVDDEDLADMVAELRTLDPKPGLRHARTAAQAVIPDVFVRRASDGGWAIELNGDALPRVIANKAYYAAVAAGTKAGPGKSFIDEAWANANWLTRSLEQRARTILKVATEIVRQQDTFLAYGYAYLRPLNLKTIAEAVSLHESTISRVTANKYMATPRGIFELKFFFSAAIPGTGAESHSAEAVRHRIRDMINAETPEQVLSDDAIVAALKTQGVEIARRTVAKYREAMRIPSSAVRRREGRAGVARLR